MSSKGIIVSLKKSDTILHFLLRKVRYHVIVKPTICLKKIDVISPKDFGHCKHNVVELHSQLWFVFIQVCEIFSGFVVLDYFGVIF